MRFAMYFLENNILDVNKIMVLLRSIYSDNIDDQCDENEYLEKIDELNLLRESVICLPFHQSIPDEIMEWVQNYFSDRFCMENFYDFRHYTQRSFILAIDETIRTLEYDMSVDDKISRVDISDIMERICRG